MDKTTLTSLKMFLLFALFTIGGFAWSAPLQFLSMNIHCYQDDWEFRFNQIIDRVVALNPDLIAFQEVCTSPSLHHSQIDFIRGALRQRGFPIGTFESLYTHRAWDRYDEYLLMIAKKPASMIDKGLLPPSLLQRGYVGIQVEGHWYINIHLEFREDNVSSRRQQLGFLYDRFKGKPHIIAGDFNSHPQSSEQNWLFREGYSYFFPGPSHVGHDGNASDRIDGFWLSPLMSQRISRAEARIVLDQMVDGQHLSDHFGVLLETQWAQ